MGAAGCALPQSPEELRACLLDVWESKLALSCDDICTDRMIDDGVPECLEDDCELRPYRWLRDDDTVVEGFFRASATSRTFSSSGAPNVSAYALDGDVLSYPDSDRPSAEMRCDDEEAIWDDSLMRRAPAGAEAAFAAAFQGGPWSAQPYL